MGTKVGLGLMVALLMAVALRHLGTCTVAPAKDEIVGGRITHRAAYIRHHARRSSLPAPQATQAVEVALLGAVEGETDPD